MFKTIAAIFLGKLTFFLSRTLKLGGGFAASGLYALKVDSNLIQGLSSQIPKQIIITGTNGKTTTSGMLAQLYKSEGIEVIRNKTGSNLERGIASVLIKHASLNGKIKEQVAIWEVDEAAFNTLAPKIKPDLIILLNVYRDQLDRYGEVDSIVNKWLNTLKKLPDKTKLLINTDDGSLNSLAKTGKETYNFTVEGLTIPGEKKSSGIRKADFKAVDLKTTFSDSDFHFIADKFNTPVSISIPGDYNVCNATAALAAKYLIGNLNESQAGSLKDLSSSFGRSEKFLLNGKEGYIFLIKNPVGATQVMQTVMPALTPQDSLILALNDNFADGKDVSWIWDIPFESYQPSSPSGAHSYQLYVSGTRSLDMALRLKYADFPVPAIESDIEQVFDKAVKSTKGRLFILPTYTALLELQKILVKKGVKKEYWKE